MKGRPGWVFKKQYNHRAIALRKRQQLETVIDAVVDRLIEKGFELTSDGKIKPAPQPRQQSWPPTAN